MQQQQPTSITFLTDVEGDGAYFDRFIRKSKILEFRSMTPCYGRCNTTTQHSKQKYNRDGLLVIEEGGKLETEWNLGEWEEDYFPYDKEVVFKDDSGDDNMGSNSMLVYGGDIWDKGGSDLYVLRQLLSLHRRYPNRVHFLMGNRDINKMRIVDELGIGNINDQNESLPDHAGVYWLGPTLCSGLPPAHPKGENIVPSQSAAERLKWMLRNTMGSVNAFELRRNELSRERMAIMNGTSVPSSATSSLLENANGGNNNNAFMVTDDEVAQSYIRSCNPVSGIMSQYLERAKLVIRFGPVLFMHGAFPFSSTDDDRYLDFPTPWMHPSSSSDDDTKKSSLLTNWIGELNNFASTQVKGWKEYGSHLQNPSHATSGGVWATEGGYFNNTPPGILFGALMQFGMGTLPDRSKTQSCVYNSWMSEGLPRDDMFGSDDSLTAMSELFKREGIRIILSGHQPVGDAPWPIQVSKNGEETKLWIMPCDTSFSGDVRWANSEDFDSCESASQGRGSVMTSGRGEVAYSEPLLQLCPATGIVDSVKIHGCLSDGSHYETGNIIDTNDEDSLLGRKLGQFEFKDKESGNMIKGMFWVKGKVGKKRLVSFGEGFNVWNAYC